jgi:hypothetical protein
MVEMLLMLHNEGAATGVVEDTRISLTRFFAIKASYLLTTHQGWNGAKPNRVICDTRLAYHERS